MANDQSNPITQYIKSNGYEEHSWANEDAKEYISTVTLPGLAITLFCVNTMPIYELLSNCAVTASLYFITWNKAYALFPYKIPVKSECYLLQPMDNPILSWLRFFQSIGLTINTFSWVQHRTTLRTEVDGDTMELLSLGQAEHDVRELARYRRIGDKHTWMVNMDTRGLQVPDTPDAVLESTTFRLVIQSDGEEDSEKVSRYSISCDDSLKHSVLKYRYVTINDFDEHQDRKESYYSARLSALWDRLNETTQLQLSPIPKKDRPAQYIAVLNNTWLASEIKGGFELPSTSKFYDDEVIAFLAIKSNRWV